MMHDQASVLRRSSRQTARVATRSAPKPRRPMTASRAMAFAGAMLVGGWGFTHVVLAVGQELRESATVAQAKKEAERAQKAAAKAEKQRLADEERNARRASAARELAQRRAGFDFYDKLGEPVPVPVEDVYGVTAPIALNGTPVSATTKAEAFSLQAAVLRDQADAQTEVARLAKLGFKAHIDEVKSKVSGTLYRVTLGSYKQLAEAMSARDALQAKQYPTQVFKE